MSSSQSVVESLDRIGGQLANLTNCPLQNTTEFPDSAIGPVEQVLVFSQIGQVHLEVKSKTNLYFSINGTLTELSGKPLGGSKFETAFPVTPQLLQKVFDWPPPQEPPFDAPPVDSTHTGPEDSGFSKSRFTFSDGSTIVTVGPSLPKAVLIKGGAAQLWVSSVGVVTQGTGIYEGCKGQGGYCGSGYFPEGLDLSPAGLKALQEGFAVDVGFYFRIILKKDLKG